MQTASRRGCIAVLCSPCRCAGSMRTLGSGFVPTRAPKTHPTACPLLPCFPVLQVHLSYALTPHMILLAPVVGATVSCGQLIGAGDYSIGEGDCGPAGVMDEFGRCVALPECAPAQIPTRGGKCLPSECRSREECGGHETIASLGATECGLRSASPYVALRRGMKSRSRTSSTESNGGIRATCPRFHVPWTCHVPPTLRRHSTTPSSASTIQYQGTPSRA